MSTSELAQVKEWPQYHSRHPDGKHKFRTFVQILTIELSRYPNFTVQVTDFTHNKQSGNNNNKDDPYNPTSSGLRVLPENLVSCVMHKDKIDTILNGYNVLNNGSLNLQDLLESNTKVDVSKYLIIADINFSLRTFLSHIEPYTWESNVVDFKNIKEPKEINLLTSLLSFIYKQPIFLEDCEEVINSIVPKEWKLKAQEMIQDPDLFEGYDELENLLEEEKKQSNLEEDIEIDLYSDQEEMNQDQKDFYRDFLLLTGKRAESDPIRRKEEKERKTK
ncbi:unnamed protein product [Candida verbasci]|uniref:Uncharacterized protein n=1 Tax=Candida verbasci TaxID=1227364 RepID=A0A9W4TVG6_9ASCO|nr:unnamed protein product [Candida verbasci]